MRKLFYAGLVLLVAFEVANVYFIMPMPGSQRVRSIDVAYALYRSRWVIRAVAGLLVMWGARRAFSSTGWRSVLPHLALVATALIVYATDFRMAADRMFIAPASLNMQPASSNVVARNRLVVGVEIAGRARAYPVQFIGYHHQVRDSIAGKPVLVTFCTVCRTGRAFNPVLDGKEEHFRLVGMDHFNAMFEDASTGSWWRQANGEAITGARKGTVLGEIPSMQMTLAQWLEIHPASLIMQPDTALQSKYSRSFDFETGASRSALTGTDTASWHDKSWVVGITVNGTSRAYDWNRLRREHAINDTLGGKAIVLALASDGASFATFERPPGSPLLVVRNDSLAMGDTAFDFAGRGKTETLRPVQASQEFWHSWRTFQPATSKY